MEKTIGIFIGIYSLILWVVIFFVWHKGYKEWKENRANRVREYIAHVLDKRETEAGERYILFGFDGRQVEFPVESSVYTALKVGEDGTLSLRGGRFESFEPKTQAEREDEIFRRMVKD